MLSQRFRRKARSFSSLGACFPVRRGLPRSTVFDDTTVQLATFRQFASWREGRGLGGGVVHLPDKNCDPGVSLGVGE